MSQAELKSLEEVGLRRGLFNLNRSSKKEKTKLEISAPIPIKVASSSDLNLTDIDSDSISNRGSMIYDSEQLSTASSSDDLKVDDGSLKGSVLQRAALFGSLAKQNSVQLVKRFSFSQKSRDETPSEISTPSENSATPSPQIEMQNDVLLLQYLQEKTKNPSLMTTPPAVPIPEVVDKTFVADLRLPPVVPPQPTEPRELVLQRRNTGDFGFSLRRTTMLDKGPDGHVYRRVVHFAEPGAGTKDLALGLVPGDRLVEINGRNVENKSRDEIVEMIRQSGDTVRLKVQPILELSELSRSWLRNSEGFRKDAFDLKTEEQIAVEQAWYEADKVWLAHKDGFSLGTQLTADAEESSLPEGKVKIKLDHDGKILDVDEDDVEKANPPTYDRVEDLASLLYLNECSVLHTLRQRYGGNLIHTFAGPNMVVVNPLSSPSMYSEKVMHMFKGCRREDTSPHVYAVAQAAYRNLLTTRQDQSIVLLGRTGSGKTTNSQHLVQYLVTIAGSTGKFITVEKWQAVYSILEAFGNSSTSMNANATRFSQIISLDFDQTGQVASASVQTMLLEKLRVAKRPENEGTFNVFYYLMAGADNALRTELHLNHFVENSLFGITPLSKPEEKQKAAQQFNKLQVAMKVLGISVDEQKAFWHILGAIYHLGAAGATKAGRRQFARHEWAQKAAYLLGCSLEELSSSIFKHQLKGTLPRSPSIRQGLDESGQGDGQGPKIAAMECLQGIASSLYGELFMLLISLINRALKSTLHSFCSIMIVDTPGFQNPQSTNHNRAGTFEELCHNYAQERLQILFYERTFLQEMDRYKEENIELALDDIESSSSFSVAAIEQASHQALVRTLARTDEARGLLWLLEEEALQPGGSENTLLERLFTYYGPQEGDKKGQSPLLKSSKPHHFILGHSHNTNWVEYDTTGWLNHAKQNPAAQNAASLLQDSQKKMISNLFMGRAGSATVLSGSIAGLDGGSQLTLRRATSMRKTFTTGVAAVKKKSSCIQIKLQVDALIDTVKKSKIHFVHCLVPKADAFIETKVSPTPPLKTGATDTESQAENMEAGLMQLNVPLLRAQIRGCKLLDALRIYRQGYPDHMVFSEFRRRFDVLAPHLTKKHGRNYIVTDEKRAVEELLESLDLEKSSYHMGLSRVFFRAGSLVKLEEQRDEQTRRNITLFQAACRGYLARQYFKKRKIQELAIRCIQKNIKKNKGVKNWQWWKLFTTVRPLIEVQLTEEQIRGKDEEIQQLRSKVEKFEKERNELRLNNDRLESRIGELTSELADERNTGESASQLLETEAAERLRLEKK